MRIQDEPSWIKSIVETFTTPLNERIEELESKLEALQPTQTCKYVKRYGERCTLNNNCTFPDCDINDVPNR